MAVISVLHTKTAKSPALIHLLRCFSFYCAYYRFQASCVHVPGAMDTAADALSRDNLTLFSSLVPRVPWYPIPLPLMELLITTSPDPTVRTLSGHGIAKSMLKSYATGKKQYPSFCGHFNCCALPVTEITLLRFVTHLSSSSLTVWLYYVCGAAPTNSQWVA